MSIDHGGQCAETSKLLFLSISLSLSPSLLNGGKETRGEEGEGERIPGPSLGLRRGLAVESKPLA